ncbi:winged helix-turn-helix transcriptional regulator [Oscillibacter sp.]|uniref:TetR/AcrR family transcriptional regulator n=1 Tax=Oscillibacter sp. TaxID=1945593 RepID=UPI00339A43D1
MSTITNEDKLLKLLAVAVVENPRSTIKELAESVGISKATLHRFCGTRENLGIMLAQKAEEALNNIISTAEKDFDDYKDGMSQLIRAHLDNQELLRMTCSPQSSIEDDWSPYLKAIDTFFLKAQKQGAFRIDFSAQVLSELFVSSICGMIDAQRRSRVASSGLPETFEDFFLHGVLNQIETATINL